MARKRMIDPDFWGDEKLGECSRDERLLFMGLISNSDDEGRGRANPKYIKSIIFPYDEDLTSDMIHIMLKSLNDLNLIQLYSFDKQEFFNLPNFKKHQTINRPTPSKLPLPPCIELSMSNHEQLTELSMSNHEQLTPNIKEVNIKEVNIKDDELSNEESKFIAVLKTIDNYPLDIKKDITYYHTLCERYPKLDIIEVIQSFAIYKMDNPIKLKDNPRSQLNTNCAKSLEWNKCLKKEKIINETEKERPWMEDFIPEEGS